MTQPGRGPNLEQYSRAAEIIGFPPELLAQPTIAIHLAFAVTSTFSDGELRIKHNQFHPSDTAMREQFGEVRYIDGTFGSHLRDLVEGADPARAVAANEFVTLGARLFAKSVVDGFKVLNTRPSVRVDRSNRKLLFDEREYPLQLDPRTVVDYGPGLAGRFHTDQQIADLRQSNSTYQYFGLAKGDFVPEFLRHYLEVRGARNPEQVDAIKDQHLFSVLSRGIEEDATHLIPPPPRPGPEAQSEGIADVVIASGIHSAGEAALNGVALAYPLLRKKGVLLIRGPQVPQDEDPGVPMDEMVQAGIEAGFRSRGVRFFDDATINPARLQYAQRAVIMQK